MIDTVYLAWRYVAFHKLKTTILVGSITLILFLPAALEVIVDQSGLVAVLGRQRDIRFSGSDIEEQRGTIAADFAQASPWFTG